MSFDIKKDPTHPCLKLEAWPNADRQALEKALQPSDIFDPGGLAAGWAPGTRKRSVWPTGTDSTGSSAKACLMPWPPLATGRSRIPSAAISGICSRWNAPYTVLGRIRDLKNALRALDPKGDWVGSRVSPNACARPSQR
jgi:hypothetical protein